MTPAEAELELLRLRARARSRATQGAPQAGGEAASARPPGTLDWDANGRLILPEQPRAQQPRVSGAEDVARSFVASGVPRGVAGLFALPTELSRMFSGFVRDNTPEGSDLNRRARVSNSAPAPGYQENVRRLEGDFGQMWEPQTTAGEYAETAGEFATNALFPGGLATRAARVGIPALTSETAGQVAQEVAPEYEGAARLVGGLTGGLATEASIAANTRRLGRTAPRPESEALEQEFGPLTRGERSGNPAARRDEYRWRMGMGSDSAEATVRGFDAERAPVIRERAMGIVTRGQPALSESVGEAGVMLGDELRTARAQLRARASQQYDAAFKAAKEEPIQQGLNDLPSGRIAAVADEFGFEVPTGARTPISILERQIQEGRATHANVERARQALNRELGSAVNSRDDAAEFVYGRVIDALDDWQSSILRNPQARRAMQEARGIYAETQQMFGRQSRADLSTGHVGRMDPGGSAIDRVINTDLTGEQIINSLVTEGKPSASVLGSVRRIRELGTGTISTTNRNAASGVRLPGRTPVGRGRRGQRANQQQESPQELDMRLRKAWKFEADAPDAPVAIQRFSGQAQQPEAILQSLREGVWQRILGPADDYLRQIETGGMRSSGMLPAQRMRTLLDNALNKSGREVMSLLYTEREIAAMQRFLKFLNRIVPPVGAHAPSSPAIHNMITQAFDKLVGIIPGIGPVLREALGDANTAGAARRAIQPPRPQTPRQVARQRPQEGVPAASATLGGISRDEEEPRRRLGEVYP